MYKQFISDNQRLVVLKAKLMHPGIFYMIIIFATMYGLKQNRCFLVYVYAVI
jgi:hypothetical protein